MFPPKVFVSYAWSTPEHQNWVGDLVRSLRDNGVEAIFDRTHLKPGQESRAFMESMVTDPSITKVLMVCDAVYVEKANTRTGGVGAESQIISNEMYDKDQQKFVAVLVERRDGKACVPAYYASRLYFDFTDSSRYDESVEEVVRWAYGKPAFVAHPLGEAPAYLDDNETQSLRPRSHRSVVEGLRTARHGSLPALRAYLADLVENLESLRGSFRDDEALVANLALSADVRSGFAELVSTVGADASPQQSLAGTEELHRFLERLLPLQELMEGRPSPGRGTDFDNFRFLASELYLTSIAVLLKHHRFDLANVLISTRYYWPENRINRNDSTVGFRAFQRPITLLEQRARRLRRQSAFADLVKERASGRTPEFQDLMQADLILFLRSIAENEGWWHPETLVYAGYQHGAFELFARASSAAFFERLRPVLGSVTSEALRDKVLDMARQRAFPDFGRRQLDVPQLIGLEVLALRP